MLQFGGFLDLKACFFESYVVDVVMTNLGFSWTSVHSKSRWVSNSSALVGSPVSLTGTPSPHLESLQEGYNEPAFVDFDDRNVNLVGTLW